MTKPALFRGGLIGCGFVAQYHLDGWAQVPDARLVAVCDLDRDRLTWARTRLPEAAAYEDAREMFTTHSLDFVEICTGPESHLALTELAASHGMHVLCQKPASLVREDLVGMIAACERAGVRLMIHENWRFRSWYRVLKAGLASDWVGQPLRIRIAHRDTRALRPEGFADQPYLAEREQLILLEMGCHLVDTARYLLGDVRTVCATLAHCGVGHWGEDVATLSLEFASGALGLLDISWCAQAETSRSAWALNETVVEGTEGSARLQADGSIVLERLGGAREVKSVPLPPTDAEVYLEGYAATQRHFVEGLRLGQEHETSGADTLKTMDVVWAGYRSAQEGRTITL